MLKLQDHFNSVNTNSDELITKADTCNCLATAHVTYIFDTPSMEATNEQNACKDSSKSRGGDGNSYQDEGTKPRQMLSSFQSNDAEVPNSPRLLNSPHEGTVSEPELETAVPSTVHTFSLSRRLQGRIVRAAPFIIIPVIFITTATITISAIQPVIQRDMETVHLQIHLLLW